MQYLYVILISGALYYILKLVIIVISNSTINDHSIMIALEKTLKDVDIVQVDNVADSDIIFEYNSSNLRSNFKSRMYGYYYVYGKNIMFLIQFFFNTLLILFSYFFILFLKDIVEQNQSMYNGLIAVIIILISAFIIIFIRYYTIKKISNYNNVEAISLLYSLYKFYLHKESKYLSDKVLYAAKGMVFSEDSIYCNNKSNNVIKYSKVEKIELFEDFSKITILNGGSVIVPVKRSHTEKFDEVSKAILYKIFLNSTFSSEYDLKKVSHEIYNKSNVIFFQEYK